FATFAQLRWWRGTGRLLCEDTARKLAAGLHDRARAVWRERCADRSISEGRSAQQPLPAARRSLGDRLRVDRHPRARSAKDGYRSGDTVSSGRVEQRAARLGGEGPGVRELPANGSWLG